MPRKPESEEVSVVYWMVALLLTWIPLINLFAIPVLALIGKNRSKKNFFRAMLAWWGIIILFTIVMIIIGVGPQIVEQVRELLDQMNAGQNKSEMPTA